MAHHETARRAAATNGGLNTGSTAPFPLATERSGLGQTAGGPAMAQTARSAAANPSKTINRKVARGPIEQKELTPSEFMRVVGLDTAQYSEQVSEVRPAKILELLVDEEGQKDTGADINEPLFQPYPSEVRFQAYNAFETYELPLTFRNVDKIGRRIRLQALESPYFKIVAPPAAAGKVAPGMDITFKILFSPDDVKDYSEDLICLSDREKFAVPLRAIGARAVIDFPDQVSFASCVVKHTSTKTLLVRNIGKKKAVFSLSASEPFAVEPKHAQLEVGQSMQVNVQLIPPRVGSCTGRLTVLYSTGEEVVVALSGSAEDANVRLEKTSLRLDNTFISQTCQRVVRLFNRSDVTVHFDWKAHATGAEEERQRLRDTLTLQRQQTQEFDEFSQLLRTDPTLRGQMAMLTRQFKHTESELASAELIQDDVFSIEPKSGDIWPNTEAEICITFTPTAEQSYTRTLYCDVTGRETRLPLKLRGDGVGARVMLACDTLDLGTAIVSSQHTYEIQMTNVGNIPAVYTLQPLASQYASCFSFTPTSAMLEPGEASAISLQFTAATLGEIDEDFLFDVEGVPAPLRLRVCGRVVGPKVHFDVEGINFGIVAFGFVASQTITLINDCDVPVAFNLHLPSDCNCLADFSLTPATGTLPPRGELPIVVDILPSIHQIYDLSLLLDAAAAGSNLLSLPVAAECVVPEVVSNTALLDFGRCFVNHPYAQTVELENLSDLPAKFSAQRVPSDTVEVRADPEHGVILPNARLTVAVSVTPLVSTDIASQIFFSVLGSPLPPLKVVLHATGQGAVLAVHPERVDWGRLAVLTDEPRSLTVSNVSLIPARFSCAFTESPSVFRCEPEGGSLAAGQSCEIVVHTSLDDTLKFSDTLVLTADGGSVQRIPLLATGVGSTIVASEPLDHLDFGNVFSNRECERMVTLTNRGRRTQKLTFALDSPPPGVSGHCTIMRGGTFKKNRTPACPNPPDPSQSVFGIFPERVVLDPGESTTVAFRGLSNRAENVEETLLIMGVVGQSIKAECLTQIRVTATFVAPLLEASPLSLDFLAVKSSNTDLAPVDRSLTLKNVSPLSLTPIVTCNGPFSLVTSSLGQLVPPGSMCQIVVRFNPNVKSGSHSRTETGQLEVRYKEHPQREQIALKAVVSFPNLVLSPTAIDFGCIVNNTNAHARVKVQNSSDLPVRYKWSILDEGSSASVGQILDILPTEGMLEPGATQPTDVLFHGALEASLRATAVCVVDDGPRYVVSIVGRASEERFHFESTALNVGDVPFDQPAQTEAVLVNDGLVPLTVSAHTRSACVVVSPTTAHLPPASKLPLSIVFTPTTVAPFNETVCVQVANAPLQSLTLQGRAIFPRLVVGLPRVASPEAAALRAELSTSGIAPADIEKEMDRRQVQAAFASESKRRARLLPYLLDFGAIVLEASATRTVRLTNESASPMSFTFNKMPHWLTLAPAKITALPPGETVDIVATMAARSSQRYPFPLGTSECTVSIDVQRGPLVDVIVRGLVCVPTLSFSEGSLDFGSVECGQCKISTLRLFNREAVDVDWSLVKEKKTTTGKSKKAIAEDAQRRAMAACFEVTPQGGVLQPGKYVDLTVRFFPNGSSYFSSELAFNVVGSSLTPTVKMKGLGVDVELLFSSQSLTIGPCLPGPPGTEATITIQNPSSAPVELYSLEFDQQYRTEEHYLGQLQCYDAQGRMLIPPRLPGAGLPVELHTAMQAALQPVVELSVPPSAPIFRESTVADNQSEYEGGRPTEGRITTALVPPLSLPAEPAASGVGTLDVSPAVAAVERYLGITERRAKLARDAGGFNGLVFGHRLAGKSAVAAALAEKYGGITLSLDAIFEHYINDETGSSSLGPALRECTHASEPNADASEAMHVSLELAVEVLTHRSRQPDAVRGLILDGISSRYVPPNLALTAILRVLGPRDHFAVVYLHGDRTVLATRQTKSDRSHGDMPPPPPEIPEDEYDALSPEEQQRYNQAHAQYKTLVKLQRQRDEEMREQDRRRMVEEEQRLEDEKKSKKSKGRASKQPAAPKAATSVRGRPSSAQMVDDKDLVADDGSIAPAEPDESFDDALAIITNWDLVSSRLASSYVPPVAHVEEPVAKGKDKEKERDKKKEKIVREASPVVDEPAAVQEEIILVEKAVVLVQIDTTQLAVPQVASAVLANPAMPSPADILRVLNNDSDTLPAPVTLSVVQRPAPRDVGPVSSAIVLVDKELQKQQQEALAALQAQADVPAEDDKGKGRGRRIDSRQSSRDPKAASANPAASMKKAKAKASRRHGDLLEDETATESDEKPVIDLDDTLRQARWVIPAGGEVRICVRFMTLDIGCIDQQLTFETMGSQRRYTVFVRGVCEYASIVRTPKVMFGTVIAEKPADKISFRGFITGTSVLDFGPVLCGKSRDGFKNDRFEANVMRINLNNPGATEISLHAVLENDTGFQTFTLEPQTCTIAPGAQQVLRVWAYPKNTNNYHDKVVICIKDNPAPIVFGVAVEGAEPAVELDRKILSFDRVLLHRKDTRTLQLRNKSKLPVSWTLTGMEQLGEDFSASATSGTLDPLHEHTVTFSFRATRAMIIKKTVRIEVSDVDSIAGIVQAENISLTAEAYDVALDINFPKHGDGGLDFETVRVFDEKTVPCTVKNKGKYELGYRFFVDTPVAARAVPGFSDDLMSISPISATLQPSEKPATVKFMFRTRQELCLQSVPMIKCEVIEPASQEVIAVIPISVSLRSVFSRYELVPARGISFGAVVLGTPKLTREIIIENKGDFEFRFMVTRQVSIGAKRSSRKSVMGASSAGRRSATTSPGPSGRPADEVRQSSHKLSIGCFTLTPAGGAIPPGGSAKILVEADAQVVGRDERVLSIDIEQRSESDHPKGIPYTLAIEACEPAISREPSTLFCDHHITPRFDPAVDLLVPTFSIEDNEFALGPVMVGQVLQARVRIANPTKVTCEVGLLLRGRELASGRAKTPAPPECFSMEQTHLSIPSHEFRVVTIEFAPTAIQSYFGALEATVEGLVESATPPLVFDLRGDGVLPRAVVLKPTLRSPAGVLQVQCRRTLVGQTTTATVVVRNDSNVAAHTLLQLIPAGSKRLTSARPTSASSGKGSVRPTSRVERRTSASGTKPVTDPKDSMRRRQSGGQGGAMPLTRRTSNEATGALPTASVPLMVTVNDTDPGVPDLAEDDKAFTISQSEGVRIAPQSTHTFTVSFAPGEARPFSGQLRLTVADNEFEAILMDVAGEGYIDDIALEGLDSDEQIAFGAVAVGSSKAVDFAVANHSTEVMRFEFADTPGSPVSVSPRAGHIAPNGQASIRAVVHSDVPVVLNEMALTLVVTKINLLGDGLSAVGAWHSDLTTLRWDVAEDAQGRLQKTRVEEPVPEPPMCAVAGTSRELSVPCHGSCEHAALEASAAEVPFGDTALLQTRSFALALRNPSAVPAEYAWTVEDDDMTPGAAACPFSISPASGTVAPGETAELLVRFAPTVVRQSEAMLKCAVAHLAPGQAGPAIRVYGTSTRPLCHIALDDGKNAVTDEKILDFAACGLGAAITKRFPVVNPTAADYHFKWIAPASSTAPPTTNPASTITAAAVAAAGPGATAAAAAAAEPEFVCQTMSGVLAANTQMEMVFKFTPTAIRTVEQTWTLVIDEHRLSFPVRLLGTAREPRVELAPALFAFGTTALKVPLTTTIAVVNDEAETFHFAFDNEQLANINRAAFFELVPAAGKVAPHSRTQIAVRFTPSMAQVYDLAVPCVVKRKTTPLTARFHADVYAIATNITVESVDGGSMSLDPGMSNIVDLGSVYVAERVARTVWINNNSKQPITFDWSAVPAEAREALSIEPTQGVIHPQGRISCTLSFISSKQVVLNCVPLTLRVEHGATYTAAVSARAQEPTIELNYTSIDFDKVFVVGASMPPNERVVSLFNREKEAITIRAVYTGSPALQVVCPSTLVQPGAKVDAQLIYVPRAAGVLNETVLFEVNSRTSVRLPVRGQAVPMRLQLDKPSERAVAFGSVAAGTVAERTVLLVNKSVLPVNFLLTADVASLVEHGLSVHPGNACVLAPKASIPIVVKFAPTGRIAQFHEEIAIQCLNQIEPLLTVTGCCQAVQVELDNAQLTFGTVAVGSQCTRRVLMSNTGDVGARFRWNAAQLSPFTVTPAEGYISPGHEVSLVFSFKPKGAKADVRVEGATCTLEGGPTLYIDLTASSTVVLPERETITFTTIVRQVDIKTVRLVNNTGAPWVLRPIFDSEYFSGADSVIVEPNSTKPYDITYLPLVMTVPAKVDKRGEEPRPHTGTVFIALPDGDALLYNLVGTAVPPRPIALAPREVPCKVPFTESITVTNWLKRSQRFRVIISKTKADTSTVLKGMDYIDIPASATKEYKLQFFAYKEGMNTADITFRNEQTMEYITYEATFRAGPPGVMDTIHLTSVVRQPVSHTITLDNPLPIPVTFAIACTNLDGSRSTCSELHAPASFRVPAKSEATDFTFDFLPVRAREFAARLALTSTELGVFQYDLTLTGTPAPPLPAERLRASLGEACVRRYKFTNFCPQRGEYTISIDSEEFSAPATIATAAAMKTGTEASFDLTYEPTRLGDCRATMTISSPLGGEYVCPLFGQCAAPRPSGPHTVRAGERLKLPFKNVFATTETFTYACDSAAFSIKPTESFRSKETKEIVVKYDAPRDDVVRTARLVVSCASGPNAGTEWIFYLKGVPA
eukprot:m.100402 g.100402  ORF g.100402 m.100402 type:complete len:4697 (-) comp14058_c0_seq1:25-14115(-)